MFGRVLWIVMLAATMAFAQRAGGGGVMNNTAGMSSTMPRAVKLTKAEMFANQLALTKEQREQVQTILNETMKEVAPLRTQIDQVRTQIVASMINGDSQDEIKKATDVLIAAQARLTGIEAKAFAQVCAFLNPNQLSKAAAAFDLWTAVVDPPGSARRLGGFNTSGRGKE